MTAGHAHAHPHGAELGVAGGALRALDARAKLVGLLGALVVGATTPPPAWRGLAGVAVVALAALLASRAAPRVVAWRLLALAPLVAGLALGLPWLRPDDPARVALAFGVTASGAALLAVGVAAAKATLALLLVTALGACTPVGELLDGLSRLGAPRVLVLLVGATHRYGQVLGEEAARMRRARDARGWRGRWLADAPVVGRLAGALFLRAHARAERVHQGMLARGWDGRARGPAPRAPGARDLAFAAMCLAVAVGGRLLGPGA